jgi:hypothetical protein
LGNNPNFPLVLHAGKIAGIILEIELPAVVFKGAGTAAGINSRLPKGTFYNAI